MNGSAFPKDIYVLLMRKYLDSRDALSLSMTHPSLYGVFSPFERFYMQFNVVPPKFVPPVPIVEEEWSYCNDCHTVLKKTSLINHYERKKCKKYVKDPLLCQMCMTSVDTKRYLTHVKRCKGRYNAEACSKCQTRHVRLVCDRKIVKCRSCKRDMPTLLYNKKRHCEICDEVVRHQGNCFICRDRRCTQCAEKECPCCLKLIDPFGKTDHECQTLIGSILQRTGKDFLKVRYNDYHNGWYQIDYQYYYIVDSIAAIPRLEPPTTTRVFLPDGKYILAFLEPGDFMWRIRPTPPHCAYCATTSRSLFECKWCGLVRYCGVDCEEMHWQDHKVECLE